MMKPLTAPITDQLDPNWRANLRAAGIPRRPLPNRPDRGYVEQPEERVEQQIAGHMRRRVETPEATPPVALVRNREPLVQQDLRGRGEVIVVAPQAANQTELPKSEPPQTLVKLTRPPPERETTMAPKRIVTRYPKEFEEATVARVLAGERGDMAKIAADSGVNLNTLTTWVYRYRKTHGETAEMAAKRKARMAHSDEFKARAVTKVLRIELGDPERAARPRPGILSEVAAKLKVDVGVLSRWVHDHKEEHGSELPKLPEAANGAAQKTLHSAPVSQRNGGPVSGPVSVAGAMPPAPTVTVSGTGSLSGLEEYINALVDRRVAEQFKMRLRMMDQVG